ncbi:MAG: hypothetical protein ACRDHZ_00655 [Ktedonobacteraceae bacterium]
MPDNLCDITYLCFKTPNHYYAEHDLRTVLDDIGQLGQDAMRTAWNAPGAFEKMTLEQKSKASAELTVNVFFFIGAKVPMAEEAAEQMGLNQMTAEQLKALGVERKAVEAVTGVMRDGKPLAFSEEFGIEVTNMSGNAQDSIWPKGWSKRGFEGEEHMGRTDFLSRNFPTVDEPQTFDKGIFTSFKTINLNDKTYQVPRQLESALENKALVPLERWEGRRDGWGGVRIYPHEVRERVLHIGIPNGTMTLEQKEIFEKIGRKILDYNTQNPDKPPIRMRLEVIW